MAAPLSWSIRCRANAQQAGRPCANWAIRGGFVCRMHGGAAPQVRAAAERRWAATRLERRLGRPLSPLELSVVTQDDTGWRRELNTLLAELKASLVE